MRQSKLFYKASKEVSQQAETISHQYLLQAGFIEQLAAGIYNFLPLGYRVVKRLESIIRQEMDALGGQEVFLAAMQPKKLWQESGRWETMDPPLFRFRDRHKKDLALGPTHEEVMTNLVRARVNSYRDLPFALYQIQTKFRNEMRSTGGLLRVREFVMKDLYSFHPDQKDLDQYYLKVEGAYRKIFKRCGLETIISEAESGSIGGSECHEFQLPADSGEDKILVCQKCGYAVNYALGTKRAKCPQCRRQLKKFSSIELGHLFKLGTEYSIKMNAYFSDKSGARKPIIMGCYGIGVGRLMAAIIEDHHYHDQQGMIWPESVAPFDVHLIALNPTPKSKTEEVYKFLITQGISTLYDDREQVSAGEKFAESDLIGIPVRLVVSKKTKGNLEYKHRNKKRGEILSLSQVLEKLQSIPKR